MKTTELRELDAWIAENVMGWAWFRFRMKKINTASNAGKGYDRWQQLIPPNEKWHLQPKYDAIKQPQGMGRYLEDETDYSSIKFTTDPAAAMEVLKKCIEIYGAATIYGGATEPKVFTVHVANPKASKAAYVESETLELAICLFAKKLFGKDAK